MFCVAQYWFWQHMFLFPLRLIYSDIKGHSAVTLFSSHLSCFLSYAHSWLTDQVWNKTVTMSTLLGLTSTVRIWLEGKTEEMCDVQPWQTPPLPTTLFKGSFKQTFIEDINLKKTTKKNISITHSPLRHIQNCCLKYSTPRMWHI